MEATILWGNVRVFWLSFLFWSFFQSGEMVAFVMGKQEEHTNSPLS